MTSPASQTLDVNISGLLPAISLWQPWASLIFEGRKQHETRSWAAPAKHIGKRIVIHAAKRRVGPADMTVELHELCLDAFGCNYNHSLPLGYAIGSVTLDGCERMPDATPVDDDDRVAGDWAPGRFAWRLRDPVAYPKPFPLIGRQGFFSALANLPSGEPPCP